LKTLYAILRYPIKLEPIHLVSSSVVFKHLVICEISAFMVGDIDNTLSYDVTLCCVTGVHQIRKRKVALGKFI
jgi:hypothetical protein